MRARLLGHLTAIAFPPFVLACSGPTGGRADPTAREAGTLGDSAAEATGGATGDAARPEGAGEAGPARDRRGAAALDVRAIRPRDTDPALGEGGPVHLHVEAVAPAAGKLFVFLPGTGGPPVGYVGILKNAAMGGYDALGLAYVNDQAVNSLCAATAPTCHSEVREEVLTGADRSSLVTVSRVDSIEHRLVALLRYLDLQRYLDGDAPRWDVIAFAGHSQGGGHAAFIAKRHAVHRAVLFAATEAAPWTREAGATAAARFWGFMHTQDPLYAFFTPSWQNLGLPGELTSVDGETPPFGGSQRLETSLPPVDGNAHSAPVVDRATPMDGDEPTYRDVWATLIGP